jgi:hypothetical protein
VPQAPIVKAAAKRSLVKRAHCFTFITVYLADSGEDEAVALNDDAASARD